mgnify:FL=1
MIMLGKYVEFNPGFNLPSIKTDFADSPYKGQKEIVEYLKKGKLVLVRCGRDEDVITHERLPGEAGLRTDGEYSWNANLYYYVEKYNLKLPEKFVDKVLDS